MNGQEVSMIRGSSPAPDPEPAADSVPALTPLPFPHVRTEAPSLDGTPLARERFPFSVVAKPSGAACNLDCQYCFFLSKELLYDVPRQRMSEDTLERYIAEFLAASADGEVTMLWQGGEPTLRGLDFFRRAVLLCEDYRRPSQRVVHAIQTNATLIDRDWAQFLAKHDVLVGVSIDGPEALHDAYRLNKGGRGTHTMVIRGWRYLQEAGVRCNVLCTVHHANEHHAREVYEYFRDELGAEFMQFIPIVERVDPEYADLAENGWRGEGERAPSVLYRQHGSDVTSRSVDPEAYGQFLSTVFDCWVKRDVGRVFVQDFDSALSALFGAASVCVHAPECGFNFAMEFNGDVYACDHWVEPDWLVGNVASDAFADLARTDTMGRFSRKKRLELTGQCRRCPYLQLCYGGCPKDRFVRSVDGEYGQNYLCAGYEHFYRHISADLERMAGLIVSGRPASDIMNDTRKGTCRT